MLCIALLLLLLIAPGRNAARLFSAANDEPDQGDAALVEPEPAGDPANAGRGEQVTADADDVEDLAATGDKNHRVSIDLIADVSDDPGVDDDRNLAGGGLQILPFGLPALHSSADDLLNGSESTLWFGTGVPVAWGGGGFGLGGPAESAHEGLGDANSGHEPNPAGLGNGGGGGDPAHNTGEDPPDEGGHNTGENPPDEGDNNPPNNGGGDPGILGSGPDRDNAGATGGDTDIVFAPIGDLTGVGNDSGVWGSPGVNGGNLIGHADPDGGQPGHDGGDHVPAPVAEPTTLTLLGSGLVFLSRTLRRRNAEKH